MIGKPRVGRLLAVATRRFVVRLYFRRIEVVDLPEGVVAGRLFACNHYNGLVDPILVLTTLPFSASPIAKSTLFRMPGLRWLLDVAEAVPVFRQKDAAADNPRAEAPAQPRLSNDAVFERVGQHLAGGGNLLIFPEGISHSEPKLQPIKTGAGRMLESAQRVLARQSQLVGNRPSNG